MKLYLGSQSPRRKELLSFLGYDFEVVSINCEENYPSNIATDKVAGYLSELKANAFKNLEKSEILLTADTIVALGNQILGKPKNIEEAKKMLEQLSGKIHQVYTAITLKTKDKMITKTDVANVEFLDISEKEIDFYIDKYQPLDKAGAYGIQEWIGMTKIAKINGNFYTIMGLPTTMVYEVLEEIKKTL